MSSTAETAERFVQALGQLEADRSDEAIVAMYTEDAVIANVVSPRSFEGQEGARRFWDEYRGVFGDMRSTFRTTTVQDDRAVLEWVTEGTLARGGDPVSYEGVSVLEVEGDRIRRFHAYFNPIELGISTARVGR